MVGHTLVRHSQTEPGCSKAPDGKPADRDTPLARMHDHIRTVVGRYKGKIHGWDVVNEAVDEDGSLRKSPWQVGIGDDYVAKAFEFAHEADPDAELDHNDYNLEKPAKRAGVLKLVRALQARKLRIDGIGNQAHGASRRRLSTKSTLLARGTACQCAGSQQGPYRVSTVDEVGGSPSRASGFVVSIIRERSQARRRTGWADRPDVECRRSWILPRGCSTDLRSGWTQTQALDRSPAPRPRSPASPRKSPAGIARRASGIRPSQPRQSRGGQHDRVVLAFVELPQPCIHVAPHRFHLKVRTQPAKLRRPPQRAGAHLRALAELGQRRPTIASRASSRSGIAVISKPAGISVGRSFRLCTARSTCRASSASSISLVNRPLPPTLESGTLVTLSPVVLMISMRVSCPARPAGLVPNAPATAPVVNRASR